jgi:organic hydroperoxide reductase OsmC/OhrA
VKILYTATGTATDQGRSGRAHSDDGRLDLQLSLPEELVALAHERCPYSRATRGNIDVQFAVRGRS